MRSPCSSLVAQRAGLWLAPLALLFACRSEPVPEGPVEVIPSDAPLLEVESAGLERGSQLYQRHCSLCHGDRGDGLGPAASMLFPPARDFTSGRFRLVSTANGAPTEGDLIRTLRRGMPGSAMPSFGWMADADLSGLAAYVRTLAVDGLPLVLQRDAESYGKQLGDEEAEQIARRWLLPGSPMEVGQEAPATPQVLARGQASYQRNCAACHGVDGRGMDERPRWNEDGTLNWARDFTAGIIRGGAGHGDLARRIQIGMPGTPMPPTRFEDPEELSALVAHVRSLLGEDADRRLVQTRERLRALRVEGQVPTDGRDPLWERADTRRLVLSPLWWRDEAITEARVAALHDGDLIAIRVQWSDATCDDRMLGEAAYGDGLALQFSPATEPLLFGMGDTVHPTNLWHWKAVRLRDVAGTLDLLSSWTHGTRGDPGTIGVDVPLYVSLRGTVRAGSGAEAIRAAGFESVKSFAEVQSFPVYEQGSWTVVLTRPMETREERELNLAPGAVVQLACALWNGSAGDNRGQKAISIWHELSIED